MIKSLKIRTCEVCGHNTGHEKVTVYKAEEHDKVNAVLDILKGTTTAKKVRKKYDITSINSVYTWIGKYVGQEKSLSLEDVWILRNYPEKRV